MQIKAHYAPKLLRAMKLSAIALLLTLQAAAIGTSAQKVTLAKKNAKLTEVFAEITKQTGYSFTFVNDVLERGRRVSIELKNASLEEVLQRCFDKQEFEYIIFKEEKIIIVRPKKRQYPDSTALQAALPPPPDISGKVQDEQGRPLSGVTVLVDGTHTSAITDSAGFFIIKGIKQNARLHISLVGYETQYVTASDKSIEVTLRGNLEALKDVVVVGYGTQLRKDLTGSVASVSGAEIAKQPVLTATESIQGKVAGVQIISSGQPNSLPIVRVRGTGTMLGGNNPLYVVDGVITDDIRNINSADIVSMDILKDASATAIYGMRAANGVLLITTKKGKPGKMQISYDATAALKEASHLVNMAGVNQYAGYLNEASVYYGTGDSLITSSMLSDGYNTDWFDVILRKGIQQNHNLSLSGGSEKINYFLSAGYLDEDGIMETNHFKRFTLRSNNEYKIVKGVTVSTLISYSRSVLNDVNNNQFNNAYRAAPYIPGKVNGKYGNTSLSNNVGNPIVNLDLNKAEVLDNRLQGTVSMELKPVSWLQLKSSFGVDLDFNKRTAYSYAFENAGPKSVFLVSGGNQLFPQSSLFIRKNDFTKWVWDNTATLSKKVGLHNINFVAGITSEQYVFNNLEGFRMNVPPARDQWYLSAGSSVGATNNNTGDKWTRNSYFGRLSYGFDNRYLLTATLRADGTSRFPTQNRWGTFPSMGLGWNITQETFMKSQTFFSNLKLRGSWGKVGNDGIPSSVYLPLATVNIPYFFNGQQYLGISFDQLPDRNVKWETNEEFDVGLDFTVLNNHLSGQVDVYRKKTKNALVVVNLPAIIGDADNSFITNAASFENSGVELTLAWSDQVGKDWNYSIGGNIAYNKNRIVGLNGGQALFAGTVGNQGFTTKSDNGQPIGSFYLLQNDGVFQTDEEAAPWGGQAGDLRYKDLSGPDGKPDGKITDLDRDFSGSYQPKILYGTNLKVGFKSFDLSIDGYGTGGAKIYNGKKATRGTNPRDNVETDVVNSRWTVNNKSMKEPRANLGNLPASTYFLESGNFFRINNVTLGYTLPAAILAKAHITRLRLFLTAQNLVTFTRYSGFTPELLSSDARPALNSGIELNAYPSNRIFAFGVNMGF